VLLHSETGGDVYLLAQIMSVLTVDRVAAKKVDDR
jgi:hypothetical protein